MKITEFSERITQGEGKVKSLSIAQIKEVLRVANDLRDRLGGKLFGLISEEDYES